MAARRDAIEELRELGRDRRSLEQLRSAPHDDPEDARRQVQPLGASLLAAIERQAEAARDIIEARRALTSAVRTLKKAHDYSDFAMIRTGESLLGGEVSI